MKKLKLILQNLSPDQRDMLSLMTIGGIGLIVWLTIFVGTTPA